MKIFLSSTFDDLVSYRKAASEALERFGNQVGKMEIFGARPNNATQASLKDLEESDLFVGVYAYRYGYIPIGATISITEQEYDYAIRLKKPMLCFIVNEELPWPPRMIEDDPGKSKLVAFKKKIRDNSVIDEFTLPDNLAFKVATAFGHYMSHSEWSPENTEVAGSLLFYGQLHGHLRSTGNTFDIQISNRDNLWRTLRTRIPEKVRKYEFKRNDRILIRFEEGFKELYPSLIENELQMFNYIRDLTIDQMYKYNSAMLKLLDDNSYYFIDIPELAKLQRHLIAWLAKYKNVINSPYVCVVYVGTEGEPFPKEIEYITEEKVKRFKNRLP